MAKTTAKSKTEKAAKAPAAKKTEAKAATPAKKKPAAKAPAKKAAPKKATADPGAALVKQCQQVIAKFDKMDGDQYKETKGKLEWCLGSYNYDKNPDGLVKYGKDAVAQLKEARS